jgi:endonuclease III
MNQALIDEITRFALYTYSSRRFKVIEEVKVIKDINEYVYKIFLEVFQSPIALPTKVINAFLNKVKFSRLLEVKEDEIKEMVCGAGKLTRKFNPNGGWEGFAKFHIKLVEKAKKAGSLEKYVKGFKDTESFYKDLLDLPSVGKVIALQIIRELRMADIINVDLKPLDLPPADPVKEVLKRIGLVEKDASWDQIDQMVRKTFKIPPLVLDVGLWHIGFYYCKRNKCDECPIGYLCPKY